MKEVEYEIVKPIGVISRKGGYSKEVNLISYAGKPPVYDIRKWVHSGVEDKMLKGITLDAEELQTLKELLAGLPE